MFDTPAESAIPDADALEQPELQDTPAPTPGTDAPKSPRELAMEAIANRRHEQMIAEGVQLDMPAPAPEPQAQPQPVPSDADNQLAAQLSQDDRMTPAADMRVKVKVDGEEMDLPLAEVVKSYQKDATASKRLQEATQLLRLAEQKASEASQSHESVENKDHPEERAEKLARVKQVFSRLYEGDEEGAAEDMLELMEKRGATVATPTAIDPDIVAAQVMQRLEVRSAYGAVQQDYPELFESTERGAVLGRETLGRMQAKISLGYSQADALKESAVEVASLFGIEPQGRQKAAPVHTARDEKLARKAALDIPQAANVTAGAPTDSGEAQSVSQTIMELAARRPGQSMRVSGRIN